MRKIAFDDIKQSVAELCRQANLYLPQDVGQALDAALKAETSPLCREVFASIEANRRVAAAKNLPLCQDTGTAVVFLQLGDEVQVTGGFIYDAINLGVAQGYSDNYLRKSIVAQPFSRQNTGDNTPAVIHTTLIKGDGLTITLLPKGGGAENKSRLVMLPPAAAEEGVKQVVLDTVRAASGSACPPFFIGVGVGGNFETAPLLAKKALLRPLGQKHPEAEVAFFEDELKRLINDLKIGAMGLGGEVTCLNLALETAPCHIASLPVAVNLNCHVARHATRVF